MSGMSGVSGRSGKLEESDKARISPPGRTLEGRREEGTGRLQRTQKPVQRREREHHAPQYATSQGHKKRTTQPTYRFDDTSNSTGAHRNTARRRPNRTMQHEEALSNWTSVYSISSEATEKVDNTRQGRIARNVLAEIEDEVDDEETQGQEQPIRMHHDNKAGPQKVSHGAQSRTGQGPGTRPKQNTPHELTFSKSISISSVITAKMDNTKKGRIERDIMSKAETEVNAESQGQEQIIKQDRKAGTHKADNTTQRRIAGDMSAEKELDAGAESRGHEEPGRVQQDSNVGPQKVSHGAQNRSVEGDLERRKELNEIQKGLKMIETAQLKLQRREQELKRQEELQMQRERQFQLQQMKASRQSESMKLSDLKRESSFAESKHASFPMSTNRRKSDGEEPRRRTSGERIRRSSMSGHENGNNVGSDQARRRASSSGSEYSIKAELTGTAHPQPRRASHAGSDDLSDHDVGKSSLHESWPVKERQRRPSLTDAPGFTARGHRSLSATSALPESQAVEAAAALHKAGRSEMSIGDYKAAISSLDRALYLYKALKHDTDDVSVANVHHDLGLARLKLGDYEAAGKDLSAAQQIRINCSDPVRAADSLKELGVVHITAGNPYGALECYSECLKVFRAELGEDNRKTAIACKDVGDAESALGKNTDACEHYEMALAIMKLNAANQPSDAEIHNDIMNLLHKLGKLEFKVGKLNDALVNLEEFCQLRRECKEDFNIHDADALYTISKIYRAKGNMKRAQEVSQEALLISRRRNRTSPISSKGNERSEQKEQKEQKKSITASGNGGAGGNVPGTSHESAASIDRSQPYIPFVQIYEEQDKRTIRRSSLKSVTLRIFYNSERARDEVSEVLNDVGGVMTFLAEDAKKILSDPKSTPGTQKLVLDHLLFDGADVSVRKIDSAAPKCYGLAIDERLFWEAYVMAQDCNPLPFDTMHRRNSNPDMQKKNFEVMRLATEGILEEVPVVMQMDQESPMNPKTLAVAYEREGQVHLASSEFYDRCH